MRRARGAAPRIGCSRRSTRRDLSPVGGIAVHLWDVVVGELEEEDEGGVLGVVGEGGQGQQQNADSRN